MEHVGVILEKAVRNSEISISELARRLDVNRKTVYNWFSKPSVKVDVISRISSAINYDLLSSHSPQADLSYPKKVSYYTNDPTEEMINHWRNKYVKLLEQYNDHLLKNSKQKAYHELIK